MDEHRRRKLIITIRDKLDAYGAKTTESIPDALDRLISEHKASAECAAETKKLNDQLQQDIELAKRGRTEAQEQANRSLTLARECESDGIRVRKALEILLKEFPAEQSERINAWIQQDKAAWDKAWS